MYKPFSKHLQILRWGGGGVPKFNSVMHGYIQFILEQVHSYKRIKVDKNKLILIHSNLFLSD